MTELHRFFDGRVAKPRRVTFSIHAAAIAIIDEQGTAIAAWPFSDMRVVDQNAVSGSYVLRLEPDHAARLEVSAGPQLDALLAQHPQLDRGEWGRRIAAAQRERELPGAAAAYRELFRELRALFTPGTK
jgi:hypothetical protein